MVGCGSMSGAWLNAARTIGGVDVVGFVDVNPDAAMRRKEEFGRETSLAAAELEPILEQTRPDCVFNCTVPEAHYPVTMAALAAGAHVLSEKPLADSIDHARAMIAAAEKAGKIFAVIQNRRYLPIIRQYRELVQSGAIGQLTTLNSDFYIGAHFGGFRDRMQHVLLLDMAIHSFDQARLISGLDPVSVYCKEWNPAGSWYDRDASAICIFTFENNVIYTYRGSWCAEGLNTSWECDWRAIGTRGTALWNGRDEITATAVSGDEGFFRPHEPVPVPAFSEPLKSNAHEGVIREFLSCVLNGGIPETAAVDNIKSLAMVFAAVESAEQGRQVPITY